MAHSDAMAAVYDGFARTYDEHRGVFDLGDVLADLMSRIPGIGHLLDLGCGAGEPVARAFIDRGWDVTGVDASTGMLALARRYVPAMTRVAADMRDVGFPPRSFDAVTAVYSLFHVPRADHPALFERIARWLRPGGVLLATYAGCAYTGQDRFEGMKEFLGQELFYSHGTPDELCEQLAEAGLTVVDLRERAIGGETLWWVTAVRPPDTPLGQVLDRRAGILDAARPAAVATREATGRRTARANVAATVDPGTFVEYGGLAVAAQRARRTREELIDATPADGVIVGTGSVAGRPVAVIAYDYTVLAGTQGVTGHRKTDRLLDVAARDGLPVVVWAEGGGGRPSDTEHATVAGLELGTFAALARITAPRVGITAGYCFAGNAALLGTCDITIGVTGASIGMGGPAMVAAAGMGEVAAGDVGPLAEHLASGAIDVEVADEAAAAALARSVLDLTLRPVADGGPATDQSTLRTALPERRRRAYDMRPLITTLCDTGSVLAWQDGHARSVIAALARIHGIGVGVLANNPIHGAGAIDTAAARKATRFLRLCARLRLPVLTLIDTPGIMVGPAAERTGLVRAVGDLFNAAAALPTPMVSVVVRKAYGLGAMAMAGGGFHVPRLTVAWPTGEVGPMALEGAVRLAYGRELATIADEAQRTARYEALVAAAYERGEALSAAEHLEIDDVIDPAATRHVVAAALRAT